MNIRLLRRITVFVGVGFLVVGLLGLAWNSAFIVLTQSLDVTPFVLINDDGHAANVTDQSNDIAHIYVRVPGRVLSLVGPTIPVLIEIWHENGMKLNSLKLVFSSSQLFSMSLEVPGGYPWPSVEFHRAADGKAILFYVSDLGLQGTGTVRLDFMIETYSERAFDLNIQLKFSMQRNAPFTFSRQVAKTQLNTETRRV